MNMTMTLILHMEPNVTGSHLSPSALVAGVLSSVAPAARTAAASDETPPPSSPSSLTTTVLLSFLRRFLPPAVVPDTARLPRRRRSFSGRSVLVSAPASLLASASAVGEEARSRSASGTTCMDMSARLLLLAHARSAERTIRALQQRRERSISKQPAWCLLRSLTLQQRSNAASEEGTQSVGRTERKKLARVSIRGDT